MPKKNLTDGLRTGLLLLTLLTNASASPQDDSSHGPDYATRCQSALWSWSSASREFGSSSPMTSTFHSTLTVSYASTAMYQDDISAEFVTLCDHHPRALGSATFNVKTTSYTTITELATYTSPGTSFPEPTPCSILPSDCINLWNEFYQRQSSLGRTTSIPRPPCATTGTADPLTAASCTAPWLYGTEAKLLYWPVQTALNDQSFCNETALSAPILGGPLPPTISITPPASGPYTFVTGTLTITSPSVGISIADLKRADGCGTTIANTIIVAPPEQISSARGVNAAYNALPFNFADLNWQCRSSQNTSSFTLQFQPPTENQSCYQDVAADAYFGGQQKWPAVYYLYNGVPNATKLVIANDYRPNVYPPQTFLETASRIWGPDVQWLVEGIWDPPQALVEQTTIEGVSLTGSAENGRRTTTTSAGADELTTPPVTGSRAQSVPSATVIRSTPTTAFEPVPATLSPTGAANRLSASLASTRSYRVLETFEILKGAYLMTFSFTLAIIFVF